MRVLRIVGIAVAVLLIAPVNAALARSAVSFPNLPLTPREQAVRIGVLTGPDMARRLYPSTAADPAFRPYQRDYRREFGRAQLSDRIRLAERVGDQGSARFAAEQGWTKLLGSENRGIRQGPDAVYWDSRSGRLRVLEAKGGAARPGIFYGSSQSTNQYAIRSAQRVLRSPIATSPAKAAAARVIVAAQKRRLETGVVRTLHVAGIPGEPKLDGRWSRANVRWDALVIERDLTKENPGTRRIFQQARREHSTAMLKHRATQGLAVLGLAGAGLSAWDAYRQSIIAWSMFADPTLEGSILPHMQTGMAIGRSAQAVILGTSSVAQLGILTGTGVAQAASSAFLPVMVAVDGWGAATAYYAYGLGHISQRDFYRRITSPAIGTTFAATGAIIGGIIGLPAGGVGALPAAAAGAKIGYIIAIPASFLADYLWGQYYRDLDARQRQRVNEAIDRLYTPESTNKAEAH